MCTVPQYMFPHSLTTSFKYNINLSTNEPIKLTCPLNSLTWLTIINQSINLQSSQLINVPVELDVALCDSPVRDYHSQDPFFNIKKNNNISCIYLFLCTQLADQLPFDVHE